MQPVAAKQRRQAVKRMIEEVLMVDRVELAFLDHVDRIGEFKNGRSARLQELGEAGNEIVDRVDMCDYVVGDHDVGKLALACQAFAKAQGKEIIDGGNADTARMGRRSRGRIDAYAGNSLGHKIAQE